jgi:Alg9-like mannosyltransferase family
MKQVIRKMWDEKPLALILFFGIFFRLIAVIFSKGFFAHDDEFLVLDPAGSWVDGFDYNSWLGGRPEMNHAPEGPSLFFPGLHYLILYYLKWRGMVDPQHKMYVIRALLALWSLITIVVGYRIADFYGGKKVARQGGLILAILWCMPMLSVRNLVEMFCIPPLLLATWMAINPARKDRLMTYFWMGILCGIAFNTRFQTSLFSAGFGLIFLFRKEWKHLFMFVFMFLVTFCAVQGIADMIIWGRPFAEFQAYIQYNIKNAHNYPIGPWYDYFLVLAGILVPPISLFLVFGYFRSSKKYTILFLPAFLFFTFHSIFPNKQERFILPMIPFVIILGCIGWNEFVSSSKYWQKHIRLLKGCWTFFWVLNCFALPFVSTIYSKRSRVESMYYLYHQKDLKNFMVEESFRDDVTQTPYFYTGKWYFHPPGVTKKHTLYQCYLEHKDAPDSMVHPNYVLFFGTDHIDDRVAAFKKMFPTATYKTTIEPSYIDILVWKLNPVNRNETVYIYKFDDKVVNLPKDSATGTPKQAIN